MADVLGRRTVPRMGEQGYQMHGRVVVERGSWRDVLGAYLVHRGLQLAGVVARRDMLATLAREHDEQSATHGTAETGK